MSIVTTKNLFFGDFFSIMRSTQLARIAKERHAGSMGYAEAMLIEYNGKKKNPAQRLSINMVDSEEAMVSFSEKGSDEQVYSNY